MRFLTRLRHAYKLTILTYPHKNSLSYASVAIGEDKKNQKRCFASKISEDRKLNGDEAFQEAFAILSLLKDNSHNVELVTESFEKFKTNDKNDEGSTEKMTLIAKDIGESENKSLQGGKSEIIPEVNNKNNGTDLYFDQEISNLNKILLNASNLLKSEDLNESTLALSTNSRLEPYNTTTIPLHLNTIINGIASNEIPPNRLQSIKVPEFNEYLTSLAANLCSAGLQSGYCRKCYSTENTLDAHSIQKSGSEDKSKKCDPSSDEIVQGLLERYDKFQNEINALASTSTLTGKEGNNKKRDPHIVCVRDGEKGCISPGLADSPMFIPKKANEEQKPKEGGLGLLDSQLYKKSLKEAEIKRKQLAKDSAACKEKRVCQSKKSDPCKSTVSTCGPEMKSFKNFESVTEPSSSFKCGSKPSKAVCSSDKKSSCSSGKGESNDPCKVPQTAKPKDPCKATCGSVKASESKDSCKTPPKSSPCGANGPAASKNSSKSKCGSDKSEISPKVAKCVAKSESKPESSLKCNKNTESKLENPCKIPPITKSKPSCESKPTKSDCPAPSKPKCASTSKCLEKSQDPCQKLSDETPSSKCFPKCASSNSCVKPKEDKDPDSQKACKRAAKVKCSLEKSCDSEPKNPCNSPCDSMNQPKAKCGRPPRGDTRPKCKKDSSCGSKKPSPCESPKPSEPKCGEEMKSSKCGSKTCAPSPKASKTEMLPKSTCDTGHSKRKTAPSSKPPERKLHTLSNFSMVNLMLKRSFADDCPDKPKSDYQPKSKRSNEYRLETCDNFSWKATKSRKKRVEKPKNCYPEETLEFCPDTACYKVYAETSGKRDKKKANRKPKATKMEKNEALCTEKSIGNPFNHQKRNFSSKPRENEEALIKKPHSICKSKLILPELSDNDALICVDSVALSDTDIHVFETGARNVPDLEIGNEASGVVIEIGKSICHLKPGDHVVLESGIPCFKCDLCKMGRYNICNSLSFKGFLKNCCIHPASFCHKICPAIPLEQAALIPQLALGCNACYEASIKPNSNVAIIGSCAMTVCAAICALSMGAENVCVMCGMPETRVLVERFVTQKVDSFDAKTIEKGIVRTILASLGTFPDIVINCSGCTKTMNAAIIALKPTGVCLVAGFLTECASFNIMDALMKEIQIVPSFRSKNMFPIAINLLESGRAPLDCLIANCQLCKWTELEDAFKLALSEGNNGPRKAIVKCQLFD